MPIDPNIALSVKPVEFANPLAIYGQVAGIQNAQNQNALAQYQLGAAQRAEAKDIARTNALAQAGTNDDAIGNALLRSGDLKGYTDFMKSRRETQKAELDLFDTSMKQIRDLWGRVRTPEDALALHEATHRDPIVGRRLTAMGVTEPMGRQQILDAAKDPNTFADFVQRAQFGAEKFAELNKPTFVEAGGARVPVSGLTGQRLAGVPEIKMQPLPADVEAQKGRIAERGAARQITQINTQLPASEEAQKEYMKSSRQTFDALKQAKTVLTNIDAAKKLAPQAKGFMGAGGPTMLQAASFLNNRIGTSIDTEGVKSAEELNSRLFLGIMDNLKKLDAQPSQQQQAALQQALGSIGTDPAALPRVLDVFGETIRQKVDLYNEEVRGAEKRGVKFPYDPVIKLPAPETPAANQIPGQRAAPAAQPMYARNPKTNERIMSVDGGNTWQPAR